MIYKYTIKRTIKGHYNFNIQASVLTDQYGPTEEFRIERSVPQGSLLSPLKWILLLNPLIHMIHKKHSKHGYQLTESTTIPIRQRL